MLKVKVKKSKMNPMSTGKKIKYKKRKNVQGAKLKPLPKVVSLISLGLYLTKISKCLYSFG